MVIFSALLVDRKNIFPMWMVPMLKVKKILGEGLLIGNYFVSLLELKKEVEKGVERLFCIKNGKIMSEIIKNQETFVGI